MQKLVQHTVLGRAVVQGNLDDARDGEWVNIVIMK